MPDRDVCSRTPSDAERATNLTAADEIAAWGARRAFADARRAGAPRDIAIDVAVARYRAFFPLAAAEQIRDIALDRRQEAAQFREPLACDAGERDCASCGPRLVLAPIGLAR